MRAPAFFALLLLAVALQRSHAISFLIKRSKRGFSEKPAMLGSSLPMPQGYLNLGLYYISVGIGTPPQYFNLHVDTGSSTLGVYSTSCSACASDSTNPPLFAYSNSSSASQVLCTASACSGSDSQDTPRCLNVDSVSQCAFTVSYGDRSKMQGVITTDVITLGSTSTAAQFGRIVQSLQIGGTPGLFEPQGVQGIMGFGHSSINCAPSCFPTVLDAFNAANLLNPYKFGMCLQPTYGNLDIGVSDPAKYSGSLTYIDFVSDPSNPNSGYYTTSMTSSKLGNTELLTGTVEAIWDSGTTLIAGTTAWSDAFKAAARAAQAAFVEELLLGTSDVAMTDAQLASWPDLKFSFPTNTSSTYTISVNSSQYMLLTNDAYKLGLDLNGQSKFLLGDVMLQMVYVEYNNVNYQLGVAPVADCTHVLAPGGGCLAGQYSVAGSSNCLNCTSGHHCPANTVGSQFVCAAGSYCPNPATESACSAGSYCPASSTSETACTVGNYCPTLSSSQRACPAGSYCSTPSVAAKCPAGYYCPAGTTNSQANPCPLAKFCPAGASNATLCTAGKYCATTSLAAVSGSCLAGYYCPAGSTTAQQAACTAGRYCPSSSGSQTLCPVGKYCPASGLSASVQCPSGSYCGTVGLSAPTANCSVAQFCPAGSSAPTACTSNLAGCPVSSATAFTLSTALVSLFSIFLLC